MLGRMGLDDAVGGEAGTNMGCDGTKTTIPNGASVVNLAMTGVLLEGSFTKRGLLPSNVKELPTGGHFPTSPAGWEGNRPPTMTIGGYDDLVKVGMPVREKK